MKKYFLIFAISLLCFYFLFSGIFGPSGYLYNKSIKEQIRYRQLISDRLRDNINNLKEQQEILSSEDGIRNSAMSLGYFVEGDTVYLFNEPSIQETYIVNNHVQNTNHYKPLSVFSIILISIGFSSIICFLIWFLSQEVSTNHNDNNDGSEDDDQESEFYIKA